MYIKIDIKRVFKKNLIYATQITHIHKQYNFIKSFYVVSKKIFTRFYSSHPSLEFRKPVFVFVFVL